MIVRSGPTPELATVRTLSDLLMGGDEIEAHLPAVLRLLLASVRRTAGLLWVMPPANASAPCLVSQALPAAWKDQTQDPGSRLHQIARDALAGDVVPPPDPALDLGAVIPIAAAHHRVGVALICGPACSPDEVRWLTYLCELLGTAVVHYRRSHPPRDHGRELAALNKIAATLTSTLQLDEILNSTIEGIRQLLNVDAGSLLLLDEDRGELVFKRALDGEPDWIFQYRLEVGQGIVGETVRSGQPLLVNDAKADPRFCDALDAVTGFDTRSVLCAPLIARGKTLGGIEVINKRDGPFDQHDLDLLVFMTASVANAIYNARLFHQLTLANAELEANGWEVIRSRNTLQALFDGITDPIYIVDRDHTLVTMNLACAQMARAPSAQTGRRIGELDAVSPPETNSGAAGEDSDGEGEASPPPDLPDQPLGLRCFDALYRFGEPCSGCRVSDTFLSGQTLQRVERRWESDDQPTEWQISTYPIRDASGKVVQVIVFRQDVTEKRRLEASLAQSEKLAAVGQLAAGVAHEINNPLAAIIANTQILRRELPPGDERQESVELIERASDRALRVVRGLLDFARQDRYEFAPTDVNESIRNAVTLVEHTLLAHSIRLVYDLAPALPLIQASHDHLQGVWLNLLLNARDAIGDRHGEVRVTTACQGSEVRATVADTGVGIPPERLKRIFEPFFTTKGPGTGTGLGLSVCHRIVKQHGGHIRVNSHPGQGTAFTVVLPVHAAPPFRRS